MFLWRAMSSIPNQNTSSRDRLVLRPLINIECLCTAVFFIDPYFRAFIAHYTSHTFGDSAFHKMFYGVDLH